MTRSVLFNFILGSVFGAASAIVALTIQNPHVAAAPPEPQKQCAVVESGGKKDIVTQEGWDFAQQAIRTQHATIERLNADLAQARESIVTWQSALKVENANLGHCAGVLKEVSPGATSTVLYESGRASVNVSLLPLPGAPRVSIGPHSELAPRWILPGRIQPQMVGETRKAMYYYFDSNTSQWQGPFAPERVVQ